MGQGGLNLNTFVGLETYECQFPKAKALQRFLP